MGLLNMFVRNAEITQMKSEVEKLITDKRKLVEEIEELKLKKRLEEEEIRHNMKIRDEKNAQEKETYKLKLEREYAEKITTFKEEQRKQLVESLTQFHGKMESRFQEELKSLKEVYSLLMQRLPNVNLTLEKRLR